MAPHGEPPRGACRFPPEPWLQAGSAAMISLLLDAAGASVLSGAIVTAGDDGGTVSFVVVGTPPTKEGVAANGTIRPLRTRAADAWSSSGRSRSDSLRRLWSLAPTTTKECGRWRNRPQTPPAGRCLRSHCRTGGRANPTLRRAPNVTAGATITAEGVVTNGTILRLLNRGGASSSSGPPSCDRPSH